MADPRIGTKNADGTRQHPTQTISGNPLPARPYSIIHIDNQHFVVLDARIDPKTRDALLLELKALVTPPKTVSSKTVTSKEATE